MAKKTTPQTSEGTFAPPPPGAPQEVTAPLSSDMLSSQLATARQYERVLAPFSPAASTPASPTGAAASVPPPAVPPAAPAPIAVAPVVPPPVVERKSHPASSDTDSPTRGIPRAIADPGKAITGGFGQLSEAQYFPLDGAELKQLVLSLMDDMAKRVEADLRFSIAITYPRVTARVKIEVEGWAEDAGFVIEKVTTHDKTPVAVAAERSEAVCFVVSEFRREFDEAGEPENPPDRIRDELHLQKPRKQFVQAGAHRMIVDAPSSLEGSF
jgi:hypothetical protein